MPQSDGTSLRAAAGDTVSGTGRFLWGADASARLSRLAAGSVFAGRLGELYGRKILLATRAQLSATLALIELDGIARLIVLCPAGMRPEHYAPILARAECDAIVTDGDPAAFAAAGDRLLVSCGSEIAPAVIASSAPQQTEIVLLTSGTTGVPKLVVHDLPRLTGAIKRGATAGPAIVWATFYDIRRYGGLQIFLRALLGGTSLVLSRGGEPAEAHLARLAAHGATHITGTPTHWRRILMSKSARLISPLYVRLSGEIADQAILDNLRDCYPGAAIAHAYASTEAGVGFAVEDGLEGFPASMIGPANMVSRVGEVEMKVEDGSLRIRSDRTGVRYLGEDASSLMDDDGFVDTGDIVERRGERYHFVGRKGGIINVGGQKVHPEEVEAIINRSPDVQISLVTSKRNPITGAVVVAEIVLRDPAAADADRRAAIKGAILRACRDNLAAYKVPAIIRFVPSLEILTSGKLARPPS